MFIKQLKKLVKNIVIIVSCFLFLVSCVERDDYNSVPNVIEGFKPIYLKDTANFEDSIYLTPPRVLKNPGKIYLYQQYLIINEFGKGVHVYDNSNPQSPIAIAFINVPFNYDISIKNDIMYADAYLGLAVIDIRMLPNTINLISFIRYKTNKIYPPLPDSNNLNNLGFRRRSFKTYFECIDSEKGIIIGWDTALLHKPKCYQ